MSEEEFFERLRERASKKAGQHIELITRGQGRPWFNGYMSGRDATIEALKEMMVGEPKKGKLRIYRGQTYLLVMAEWIRWALGREGTDGEEVTVMVFRW